MAAEAEIRAARVNRSPARFRRAGILRDLPEACGFQARTDLLDETLTLAGYSALLHLTTALLLTIFFWDTAGPAYLLGLLAAIAALVGLGLFTRRRFRQTAAQGPSEPAIDRGIRLANALALTLGLAWATMPVVLFAPADGDRRLIVVGVAAGLIADAYALGPLLSVSYLFAIPVVVGSFLGLARCAEPVALSLAILLTVYAAFVLTSVTRMARLSLQRILDRVRVEHQSRTIGRLINEVAAGGEAPPLPTNTSAEEGGRSFDALQAQRARRRRDLDAAMRPALAAGEMALHYQPLVSLCDGRVVGFEALLRWVRPGDGPVSPAEIIPIAESTGFVVEIGRWALVRACAEAANWPAPVRVAVNISSTHLRLPDFLDDVRAALARSGLAPGRLEIEITESVFLGSTPTVLDNLERLHALGVRIALDDFGTGFSSLSYLTRFPVDKIKVDRAFVRDLGRRREGQAVIDAIMMIARTLGIEVTAEGVETREQADLLRLKRCDNAQGFFYSPARPPQDLADLLVRIPHRHDRAGAAAARKTRSA